MCVCARARVHVCIYIYIYLITGIPVWVGKELYTRYEKDNKHKRNAFIVGGVTASVS